MISTSYRLRLQSALFLAAGILVSAGWAHASDIAKYQRGSTWGKRQAGTADLADASSALAKAVRSAARFGDSTGYGTSFYLGKFAGRHLMGTNFHVARNYGCSRWEGTPFVQRIKATFPMIQKSFPCVRSLGKWEDIDFSIFEIRVSAAEESLLKGAGVEPAFGEPLRQGQLLLTAGFGAPGNPDGKLMVSEDADCRVMSGTDEFRLLADPDRINPETYKAWSFAQTCDSGHGDSGSAYLDRETGRWVGVIWTGAFPGNKTWQDSSKLEELFQRQGPEIWSELGYAVPLAKIREKMTELLDQKKVGKDGAAIQAWLDRLDENR